MHNREKKITESYKIIFDTEDGKKVLQDLANFCGETRSNLNLSIKDIVMQYGIRSVYIYIRSMLETDEKGNNDEAI